MHILFTTLTVIKVWRQNAAGMVVKLVEDTLGKDGLVIQALAEALAELAQYLYDPGIIPSSANTY